MPVVRAHPVRRISSSARFQPDALRTRLILRMPAQDVVVAVCTQVQEATGRGHKFDGCLYLRIQRQIRAARPFFGVTNPRQCRTPLRRVVIAQSSRRLLHIRLQVKDGAAKARIAVIERLLQEPLDCICLTCNQRGKHLLLQ